ncbi:transposase [Rhodococcus jostii]|uniref:transposase n=1 Tax=Rhodococcus jostii TaxID=132919 RepID=UPI00366A47C5
MYPSSSATDAQWAILEPLLPPPGNTTGSGGRPEKHCRRLVLDAIFYVVRGGIVWRLLPAEFLPRPRCARSSPAGSAGVWQRIHDALRDRVRVQGGRHPLPSAAIVDSQSVQGSDTVPGSSRGYDGQVDERPQTAHRCGLERAVGGGRGDDGRDSSAAMARSGCWPCCAPSSRRSALCGPTVAMPDG